MKFSIITVLAAILLASLTTSLATPDAITAANGPRCETSNASPWTSDVVNVANIVAEWGSQKCQQRNPAGSQCTTLASSGKAKIGICGASGDWVLCKQIANAAKDIAKLCSSNTNGGWRSGGYVIVDNQGLHMNVKVIVF